MTVKKTVQTLSLARGRNRHSYLRKVLSKVKTVADLEKSFVREIGVYLKQLFALKSSQILTIKAEVPIMNRRPDFVIHIPGIALIFLEYKTTLRKVKARKCYQDQTLDTFAKALFGISNSENCGDTMKMTSLLLVRNSSTRQNKLFCVKMINIAHQMILL